MKRQKGKREEFDVTDHKRQDFNELEKKPQRSTEP